MEGGYLFKLWAIEHSWSGCAPNPSLWLFSVADLQCTRKEGYGN